MRKWYWRSYDLFTATCLAGAAAFIFDVLFVKQI
jgi:hypothetical protein